MQQKEWKFGAHSMRQEAPDVIHAIYSGPISLDEMKRAVELYGEFGKNGPYYLIAEIAQSQLGAESRRYLSENGRSEWFKAAVYVGADMVQQTFTKVIALGMLFIGKSQFETVFVKTLPEAQAWVEQNRVKLQKKNG